MNVKQGDLKLKPPSLQLKVGKDGTSQNHILVLPSQVGGEGQGAIRMSSMSIERYPQ